MVHRENYRILWITWQRDYEVKFCASTLLWYQGRLWTTASLNETCLSIVHYNWISSCRWHVIYFFDAAGTNDGDSIIFEIVWMVCRLCRSRINLSRLTFGDRLIKKKKKKIEGDHRIDQYGFLSCKASVYPMNSEFFNVSSIFELLNIHHWKRRIEKAKEN